MRRLVFALLAACASPRSEPVRHEPARRHEPRPRDDIERQRSRPGRGPVHTTPWQLFVDFTRPDADGLALLDKYAAGARFTATIKTVGFDDAGKPVVWIDIDGENVMSLEFAEAPRTLRPGAQLTVTCRIGGASGALMMVTGCRA